jgi:alpha-beta hydrolase superfamily lysophospholipase
MNQHTDIATTGFEAFETTDESAPDVVRITHAIECDGGALFAQETLPETDAGRHYVLFVHGNTFPSAANFDLPVEGYSLVEYLASQGLGTCIFDNRGYGRSYKPRPGEPIGVDEWARDLEAVYRFLVEERRATSIALVGLSVGCNTIAAFMARARPDVSSVVFIGPAYANGEFLQKLAWKTRLLRALRALTGSSGSAYVEFTPGMFVGRLYRGYEHGVERAVIDEFVRQSIGAEGRNSRTLKAPVLAFPRPGQRLAPWQPLFDVEPLAAAPLLMLRGSDDEICCERTARSFVADCERAGVDVTEVTLAGRGHNVGLFAKHADTFAAISRFVHPDLRAPLQS